MKGCCYRVLKAMLLFVVMAFFSPVFADPSQATSPSAPIISNAPQVQTSTNTPASKPSSTPAIKKTSKYVSQRKAPTRRAAKPQKPVNKKASTTANKTLASTKRTTSIKKPSVVTHHTSVRTVATSKAQTSSRKTLASTQTTKLSHSPHHYYHHPVAHHLQAVASSSHPHSPSSLKSTNSYATNADNYNGSSDVVTRLQQGNTSEDMAPNNFNQTLHERIWQDRYAAGQTAKAQIGTPYQWGGEAPGDGFDCSGLSQFVYEQEGISIPRTAAEQYRSLIPVKYPQEGDLVFFRTHPHSSAISHVGIYIGDGYFVDSPRTGESVRLDRLDNPYWKKAYAGARRVLTIRKVETQQAQISKTLATKTAPEQVAQVPTAETKPAPIEASTTTSSLNNNSAT